MRRLVKMTCLPALCVIPVMTTGCVQQDKYDQLQMANRSLKEQIVLLEDERDTYKANLDQARAQAQWTTDELGNLKNRYGELDSEFNSMLSDNDRLMRDVATLQLGPLPADVESALVDLAAAYPDVMKFNPNTGMLQFASDFTFGLGSVALTEDANQTLAALANILNTTTATNFEVHIVGHTDNVPIKRADTRAKHPTNRHLSVHRAISVADKLQNHGVSAARIQVAGYGEHRPIVANKTGGAAANRRVEIYFVPMQGTGYTSNPGSETTTDATNMIDEPLK